MRRNTFLIGVTGAQGVGKSTFCRNLVAALRSADLGRAELLDGIRASIQAMGVPFGSASTAETIFAVWTAHLERESSASDALVVLDRCCIDALAYTRVLNVSSDLELRLFNQVALLASDRLDLVIHLRLSPFFEDKGAAHETAELRAAVAREIAIVLDCARPQHLELDASSPDAIDTAIRTVHEMLHGR